jgi:hypothetical protein
MQNEEIQQKNTASCFRSKDYTLPSGKVVRIHGYEPRCMDILLSLYREDEIQLRNIPQIWYINPNTQRKHRYFPDMYIPHMNLMIEVKSTWTLRLDYERNMAKFRATVETGYDLHLYVFDEKKLLYVQPYTQRFLAIGPLAALSFID